MAPQAPASVQEVYKAMSPQSGDPAPTFTLPDQDGRPVSLANYLGRRVVVYFYPRDDTPGCTTEACGFNDVLDQLSGSGVEVIGISTDNAKSHVAFRDKFQLRFPLLSDSDHLVHEAYGAWGERQMMGRRFMGTLRSTFAVGADGRIEHAWLKVSPEGHATEVMQALEVGV